MTQKQYDYIVFIGRFQPLHRAHTEIIDQALELANQVVIVIGSAEQPRTIKNPWTVSERRDMIRSVYEEDIKIGNILFAPAVQDRAYNDQQWAADVQDAVRSAIITNTVQSKALPNIAIIGHHKDETSYYLEMFPQWKMIEIGNIDGIHARNLRGVFFHRSLFNDANNCDMVPYNNRLLEERLPPQVLRYLKEFEATPTYKHLQEEFFFIYEYRRSWLNAPYIPTFVTTDAVVVQSGHILLVKRRAQPGKGLWALPGGFLKPEELIVDSMIRELREETKLKVPEKVLKGSIQGNKVFDHPTRSLRGRTITHAFLIELEDGPLPKVKGSDDAEKAKWFPLNDFATMREQLFEDHYDIAHYFLGQV